MLSAHREAAERALWSTLRVLEERSALMKKVELFTRRSGHQTVGRLRTLDG